MPEFKAHPPECWCNPHGLEHEGRTKPAAAELQDITHKKVVSKQPKPKVEEHPLGLEGEEVKRLEAWEKRKNKEEKKND